MPSDLKTTLQNRGVRSAVRIPKPTGFVGSSNPQSFHEVAGQLATRFTDEDTDVASLGGAYNNLYYQKTAGSREKTYEPVYSDVDWAQAAEDPNVRKALDSLYGDSGKTDAAGITTPNSLRQMLAPNTSKATKLSPLDRQRELAKATQGVAFTRDEMTTGIRGVSDLEAPIDPIA